MFDNWRGFEFPSLPDDWHKKLSEMSRNARGDILKMTTLASSGHPGGSMSFIEIYMTLFNMAKVDPKQPKRDDRDRIVISNGHTSPGAYSSLAAAGYFNREDAIAFFRKAGSPFEGHVEQSVPGIEWDTGNLGQGLSVGIGKALYGRLTNQNFHTYVLMGDGEQQKGQISESRRIAKKYKINNITAIIDYNRLQISGSIEDVMPQAIADEWKADGWKVVEIDGHDLNQIYNAFKDAKNDNSCPTMILASTIMGKGVSFMENKAGYHGAPIKPEELDGALEELGGLKNNIEDLKAKRSNEKMPVFEIDRSEYPTVDPGKPRIYAIDEKTDNRSAFGNALVDVADANMSKDDFNIGVFDCDLAGSVKTAGFEKKYPDNFFQFGITEHSTATAAGSLSAEKAVSVWADFGVFALAETYNQARLNDINHSNMKLFCTHCGINVGEDGKTHQSIDYFGLLNSTFGWKVITPADPNQTDRVVRYVLSNPGNFAVIMGRSKLNIISDSDGKPFFGENYKYEHGRVDFIRDGSKVVLAASGNILANAFDAWQLLDKEGVQIKLVSISDWSEIHTDDLKLLASEDNLVVLEDHNVKTGLGQQIAAKLFEEGLTTKLIKIGVENYAPSGSANDLYKLIGLDGASVAEKIKKLL